MLDPNTKTRITSRQLTQIIHLERRAAWYNVKKNACPECDSGPAWKPNNLPIHSILEDNTDIKFPAPPRKCFI